MRGEKGKGGERREKGSREGRGRRGMRNRERKIKRRRRTGNYRDFPHWSSQDERRMEAEGAGLEKAQDGRWHIVFFTCVPHTEVQTGNSRGFQRH